mmetsp:Transcript_49471/g.90612  ORF Transcript_49471/g.90612 Transcript_49471/m.90612 type:complete len:121 (-) Transcript_49471:12-374(-)
MTGLLKQTIEMLRDAKPVVQLDDAINALFEIYDIDKSGFITIDEMVRIDKVFSEACQTAFNEDEVRSAFSDSDANKDSKVSLAEFNAHFKELAVKTDLPEDRVLAMVQQTNDILIANKDN